MSVNAASSCTCLISRIEGSGSRRDQQENINAVELLNPQTPESRARSDRHDRTEHRRSDVTRLVVGDRQSRSDKHQKSKC